MAKATTPKCDLQQRRRIYCWCCYWVEKRKASHLNKHGFSYTCVQANFTQQPTVTMKLAVLFFQCRGGRRRAGGHRVYRVSLLTGMCVEGSSGSVLQVWR